VSATRSNQTRYPRWVLPLAVLAAIAVAAVAFPFQTLWRQQGALNQAQSQIAQINRQSAALAQQAKAVSTEAAAIALAREDYQLVQPGQRLIQVLPGNGSGYVAQNSTDPGAQPLVNIGEGLVAPSSATSKSAGSSSSGVHGFVSRFVRTLEFWR
jgi:predicted membrane-bound mannosyltransferase